MHSYSTQVNRLKIYIILGLLSAILVPPITTFIKSFELFSSLEPWISVPSFGFIYLILFNFYNNIAWKWGWLKIFGIISIPDLAGDYSGKLISSYDRNKTISLRIEIEQTWTKLVVRTRVSSKTSYSYSYMAYVNTSGNQTCRLDYTYTNKVLYAIAEPDMEDHDGTVNMIFSKDGSINGTYFNARKRKGAINLKKTKDS